jgi:DNA-binding Xre family transcriptional regulator
MVIYLHIKELAEQKNITRTMLSRQANITYNTANKLYKNSVQDVSLITLIKVSKVLNVNVSELYSETE